MASGSNGDRPGREQATDRQSQATRSRILSAARAQFETRSYVDTTLPRIAEAAGVAVSDIEVAFGTKPVLLQAVLATAVAGDDRDAPAVQRPWARSAGATTDPIELLSQHAVNVRAVLERVAPLAAVLHAAASSDPDLFELAGQFDRQRAVEARIVVTELANRGALRSGLDIAEATDVLWLLQDPLTYRRLVVDRGWSPAMYQTWLAETSTRLLVQLRRTRPA